MRKKCCPILPVLHTSNISLAVATTSSLSNLAGSLTFTRRTKRQCIRTLHSSPS
jgi:hypothetical protein